MKKSFQRLLIAGICLAVYLCNSKIKAKAASEMENYYEIDKATYETSAAGNPVLKGQYADPDIDVFDGKYYMYCTTDGFPGWSGTKFHCFSSENLRDWKDEGVILDVAKGKDVEWSVGSGWAPAIEEKDGKYYFYFCAKLPDGNSSIGVAVADNPAGPYTAEPEPLLTKAEIIKHKCACGQAIDPSVFTEDDGTHWLLFGNGYPTIVQLNDDMISVDWSTIMTYFGAKDFREALTVTKRDGIYHFTWSCDDTGSPDYHVNYGTSDSLTGKIEFKYTILEKDSGNDILGTGHHCILRIPGTDEYYIAYHRFYTPLHSFTDGTGHHRETCIDRLTFNSDTGLMEKVIPTNEGVSERRIDKAKAENDFPLSDNDNSQTDASYIASAEISPAKEKSFLVSISAAVIAGFVLFIKHKRKDKK